MPTQRDIYQALEKHLFSYAFTTHQILTQQGQLEDFLQDFLIEANRRWKEPENSHQYFIDFVWKYARMRVTLPSRRVYSLIVLRGVRFSMRINKNLRRCITKEYSEIVDFADYIESRRSDYNPYISIDTRLELVKLRKYLVANARQDVVDYFDLLTRYLEKSEISSSLKLSTHDTGLLQERFRYYVNRYQGISPYNLKRKTLVNHRKS